MNAAPVNFQVAVRIIALGLVVVFLSTCVFFRTDQEMKKDLDDADIEKIPSDSIIDTTQNTLFPNYQIGSCENLILEVVSRRDGMILPRGKILDIRVLKNRNAEYDFYDYPSSVIRREFTLSELQYSNLVNLLESNAIANSKPRYVSDSVCIDSFLEREITYCSTSTGRRREIHVNECGSSDFDKREKLPSQIVSLLLEVDKLTRSNFPSSSE